MRTAHVIGAGGIGVAIGWALARAGWDITMVDTHAAKLDAGRRDGISVEGVGARNVRFCAFAEWTPPADAVLLLCTKTYDNASVLARLADRKLLIPVQNGFDPELTESNHPTEGVASFVSECDRDRPATRITRPGALYLGGRRALVTEERRLLEDLAKALQEGGRDQVRVVDRIGPYKYSKLMYNAAVSPLAAAAGVDNGQLLTDPVAQRLFFALLRENYSILHRKEVQLARIGPFHPWMVDKILRVPSVAQSLAHLFRPSLQGTYCSMAPDMGSGRTEIEAYNGYLQEMVDGVGCPINTAVLEMMRAINERGLPTGRERLVELQRVLVKENAL